VKKHLGIVKELGLFLLLFVLASAVAASEDAYEIVTIVQTTSSESDDANTVITIISGDGSTTTDEDDTVTDEDDTTPTDDTDSADNGNEGDTVPTESTDSADSGANDNLDQGTILPDFQLDGPNYDGYSDELSEWIQSLLDKGPISMIDDFPQDITHIINVE
jgi:hypothetical protein